MIALTLAFGLLTPEAHAQSCEDAPIFRAGGAQVWHTLDKKGRQTGSLEATTQSVTEDVGAYTAEVVSRSLDAKGNTVFEGAYTVRCNPFEQTLDLRAAVGATSVGAYQGWSVQAEGGALPFDMAFIEAGKTLPDAALKLTFTMADAPPGLGPTTMHLRARDRRVEAQESVSVPAGTFDALRVRSTLTTETRSLVGVTVAVDATDWFVPGVGVVKSETWRKGKLVGSTVLAEQRP